MNATSSSQIQELSTIDPGTNDNLSKDATQTSISSVRVTLSKGDAEVVIEKKSIKGIMSGRTDNSVARSLSPKSTRDAVCDCRSSSSGSKESINCSLEMEKLKASLNEALIKGGQKRRCRKGKCYKDCKLFNSLTKICDDDDWGSNRQNKNYTCTSESDDKGTKSPCCPSTCRCAIHE